MDPPSEASPSLPLAEPIGGDSPAPRRSARRARTSLGDAGKWRTIAWVVVVGLIATPPLLWTAADPLSGISWQLPLVTAHAYGFPWGSRVVWTYGPLGFVIVDYPVPAGLWIAGVGLRAVIEFGFLAMLAVTMRREVVPLWVWIGVTAVLLLDGQLLAGILVPLLAGPGLGVILAWYAVIGTARGWSIAASAAAGIVLGILPLMQVSFIPVSAVLLVMAVAYALRFGRGYEAIVMPLAAVIAGAAAWFSTGQSTADIGPYISSSLALTSGYANAMQSGPIDETTLLSAVVPVGLVVLAIVAWRMGARRTMVAASLLAPVCYLAFKEGFVRHDAHDQIAYAAFALALILLLVVALGDERRGYWPKRVLGRPSRVLAVALSAFALLGIAAGPVPVLSLRRTLTAGEDAVHTLTSGALRKEDRQSMVRLIEALSPLPRSIVAAVRGHSVDIFPMEVADAWAYALDWDPRPVLQSYSAYMPLLDARDAACFGSPAAPARLSSRWPRSTVASRCGTNLRPCAPSSSGTSRSHLSSAACSCSHSARDPLRTKR
jgi:hypothetical protein